MNYILHYASYIPNWLKAILLFVAIFTFLNSGFVAGYIMTRLTQPNGKRKPTREEKIERCIKWLKIARRALFTSQEETLARACASGFVVHLDELLADLHQLENDSADAQLYNLVETKMNDLKFQFGRCLLRMDKTQIEQSLFDVMDHLAQANLSIQQ